MIQAKRILAVNFGGIGDEILFFPVLQSLREAYPQAWIAVLVEPRCRGIMAFNPAVDEVLTFDVKNQPTLGDFLRTVGALRERHFDLAIASGSSPAIPLLLFLSGAPQRVGYDANRLSGLLTHRVPLKKEQYAARMYYDLVSFLGIEFRLPQAVVAPEDGAWAKGFLGNPNRPVVVFHPGVSQMGIRKGILKSWHPHRWAKLIAYAMDQGWTAVLAGGPDDEEAVREIRSLLDREPLMAYGQTKGIGQLAALIEEADALVAVDSAPMHMAVAVGTPVVAIFGPTDPDKLLPTNTRHKAVFPAGLECRPCLWAKRSRSCEPLHCLDGVTVEMVEEALARIVAP
ncbi:MAG: glycosyltransferase family 9 protein [Bacteroidota bacterium]